MAYYSPLRYPGGKARLAPWLGEVLRHNNLSGGCYVEPYAGGAGAALQLLIDGYTDHIVINDADYCIYAFWHAVLYETEEFLKKLRFTRVSVKQWEKQRQIYNRRDDSSLLELGFATFYLNRTNRSGIIRGRVIGGMKQDGNFPITARFNKADLKDRVSRIAKYKNRISIYNQDAIHLIKEIQPTLPKKALIYLDPPYYNKGQELYESFYSAADHRNVAKSVSEFTCPWIVTYDNCEPIQHLYQANKHIYFDLYYSANVRRHASEIMVYSNLELPSYPFLRR